MWHESGYDSDGYWSEDDRNMSSKFVFTEPGKYYVKFNKETIGRIYRTDLSMTRKTASGIPHLMLGAYVFILSVVAFILINPLWVRTKLGELNEKLEEMYDD